MTYTLETRPEIHLVKGAKFIDDSTNGEIIISHDGELIMLPSNKSDDEIIKSIVEKTDLWAFCAELPEVQDYNSYEGSIQYLYVKSVLDKFHKE